MQCKVCGCTDDNPCMVEGKPCSWAMKNLCTACVIEIPPGEHSLADFKGSLLIEKMCRNCAKLELDKEAEEMGYKNYWHCSEGRFDEKLPDGRPVPGCYAWSTICKPGKAVLKAQAHCPLFEVHPKWRRHEN